MILWIKQNLIVSAVIVYAVIGLGQQCSNGIIGTHFVIKDLTDVWTWVFAQLTANHWIDSTYNTVRGEKP